MGGVDDEFEPLMREWVVEKETLCAPDLGRKRTDLVVDIGIAKLDFMFETLAT